VLQPENPDMVPIVVKKGERQFQILGKVIGIMRRM